SRDSDKTQKAIPLSARYFLTRTVVFCSARNGLPHWQGCPMVPIEFLHATAPVWFHSVTASLERSLCTDQESLLLELMTAYDRLSSRFLGHMHPVVQCIVHDNLRLILNVVQASRDVDRTRDVTFEEEDEHARQVRNENTYRLQWDELFGMLAAYRGIKEVGYQKEAKLKYAEAPPPEMTETEDPYARPLPKKPVLSSPREVYVQAYPYRPLMSELEDQRAWWWTSGLKDEGVEKEPLAGVADGILYLTVPDVFSTYGVADAVNIWSPNLESDTNQDEDGRGGGRKKAEKTTVFPGNVFATTDEPPTFSDEDRSAYQQACQLPVWRPPCTAATAAASQTRSAADEQAPLSRAITEAQTSGSENVRRGGGGSKVRARDLYIPLSANEFKKLSKDWDVDAATEQERLHLVSICSYLRLFGVSRFPVYGLVTSGAEGVISCAWNELVPGTQKEKYLAIFIADQDAVHVDIREPLGALNVATYIAYIIAVHAPRLRQLFQEGAAVHSSLQQYLSEQSGPTPLQRARAMTMEDGRWHKPLS
ncbi:hypothetical protein EV121DRAFT_212747, partial [Schizophyllum commune]